MRGKSIRIGNTDCFSRGGAVIAYSAAYIRFMKSPKKAADSKMIQRARKDMVRAGFSGEELVRIELEVEDRRIRMVELVNA